MEKPNNNFEEEGRGCETTKEGQTLMIKSSVVKENRPRFWTDKLVVYQERKCRAESETFATPRRFAPHITFKELLFLDTNRH